MAIAGDLKGSDPGANKGDDGWYYTESNPNTNKCIPAGKIIYRCSEPISTYVTWTINVKTPGNYNALYLFSTKETPTKLPTIYNSFPIDPVTKSVVIPIDPVKGVPVNTYTGGMTDVKPGKGVFIYKGNSRGFSSYTSLIVPSSDTTNTIS